MATFSFNDFVHRFIFQVKNGKGKYSLRIHMNRTINSMYSTVSISMCFWCWEWFLIDGWASGKESANNSCCSFLMCFTAALFFHHFCGSLFVKHLKSYKIALFCRWLKFYYILAFSLLLPHYICNRKWPVVTYSLTTWPGNPEQGRNRPKSQVIRESVTTGPSLLHI